MAIFNHKRKNDLELGFGSKSYKKTIRFINTDGTINVKRTGSGALNNIDVYHWLIMASRWQLTAVISIGYVAINLLFAVVYYLIGPDYFGGIDSSSEFQKFISLFFFSAQTITTLGYGHIYPTGNAASVAAAVVSLLGLLSFAIATGILFGRFSRPKADVLYSKHILIAPYDEITGLMFRIANQKQYELIEAEAGVSLTIINPETKKRDFFSLELEINRINFLPLSWTIVHPIEEKSPLFGLTVKDLEERDAEILILVKAINDTFSQTVYSRYSYKSHDFIAGAKFKPIHQEATENGKVKIRVNEIHKFDKVN